MNKKFIAILISVFVACGIMATAVPAMAAEGETAPQTLQVSQWTEPTTLGNVSGRPAVIKVGDTYHMWYGVDDHTLKHTSSTYPDNFTTGTLTNFDTATSTPAEVGSVTVYYEGETFYMIAYGATDDVFNIYTSDNETDWTNKGIVFDGTSLPESYSKIDAPYLFKDNDTYRLYFQVKNAGGTSYSIYTAEATGTLASIADGNDDADFALANSNGAVLSPGTSDDWDGTMVMHPMVVKDGDTYYMWYSAHNASSLQQIGMATSGNGYSWVKSRGNPILPRTTYDAVGEPSVIKDKDTWRMWYLATGNAINYLTATGPFEFSTIQSAIDKAVAGDIINVAEGTYTEILSINTDDLTIEAAEDEAPTIKAPTETFTGIKRLIDLRGSGVMLKGFEILGNDVLNLSNSYVGISVSGSNVIIENNSVKNLLTGIQTTTQSTEGNVKMLNNKVSRTFVGISLQNNSNIVEGNTISDIASEGMGIGNGNTKQSIITNNSFDVNVSGVNVKDYDSGMSLSEIANNNNFNRLVTRRNSDGEILGDSLFVSIQDAIDAANNGDTINVAAGTYAESISVNKSLTLLGAAENAAIISPTLGDDGITVSTSTVTIDGFAITGAVYGIKTEGNSDVVIKNNKITEYAKNGVYVNGGTVNISTNVIKRTTSDNFSGDSIYTKGGATVTITNNTLSNNKYSGNIYDTNPENWSTAAGFSVHQGDKVTATGNIIYDNDFGIHVKGGETEGTNPVVVANSNQIYNNDQGFFYEERAGDAPTSDYDATDNWWGDATGPKHATSNPNGEGNAVSDYLNYNPWYTNVAMTTLSDGNATNATYTSTTEGEADMPEGATEIILTNSTVLDLSGGLNNNNAVKLNSGTFGNPIVLTNSDLDNVSVSIPDGTTIQGPTGWNGKIAAPTVTTVNLPATSGETKTLSTAIEVGSPSVKLSFDKAVKLLLPGQAGKRVIYTRDGGVTSTEITTTCTPDDQPTIAPDGDCKIDVGSDLVIWTKHFTTFATYTQTPTPITGSYIPGQFVSTAATQPTTTTKPEGEVKGAATEGGAQTVEELQQLVNQILKQLQSILIQLVQSGRTIPPGFEKYLAGISLIQTDKVSDIERDLYLGLQEEDVKLLQNFLINQKKGPKSILLSSYGPTGYFGSVTQSALAEYQASVGIKPAIGYFGPITRSHLKSIGY